MKNVIQYCNFVIVKNQTYIRTKFNLILCGARFTHPLNLRPIILITFVSNSVAQSYIPDLVGVTGFTVDANTGTVSFTGTLDREGIVTYYITVSAYEVRVTDTNTAISEPAFSSVIVTVTDVNDNAPTFFATHYQGTVSESSPDGHVVVQGVRAFDVDEGTDANFVFALLDPSSVPFTINPTTGVISVDGALDYETTTSYTFTVRYFTSL